MSYTETLADGTILGDVPGVLPGTFFRDRQELHAKRLHRGLMRGIAPHGSSIVLSGGYVDDQDLGDVIIYTGEGGRDPNTGRQIADQQLVLGNKALAENHLNGIPIRVHRGRAHVPDMPQGFLYRYDGLYRVARYWQESGQDGFKIWRFRIERDLIPGDLTPTGDAAEGESVNISAPAGKAPLADAYQQSLGLRAAQEWENGSRNCMILPARSAAHDSQRRPADTRKHAI